jgi:hypothetical protein
VEPGRQTHYICSANALKTPGLCIHLVHSTAYLPLSPVAAVLRLRGAFESVQGCWVLFLRVLLPPPKKSCRRLAARAASSSQLVIRGVRLVDVIGSGVAILSLMRQHHVDGDGDAYLHCGKKRSAARWCESHGIGCRVKRERDMLEANLGAEGGPSIGRVSRWDAKEGGSME